MITMEWNTTGERLKQVRKALNMKQKDFARLIRVQQPNLSDYENGKVEPEYRTLQDILRRADVSEEWWESGQGEIFIAGSIKQKGTGNIAGSKNVNSSIMIENEELTRLRVEKEMLQRQNEQLLELIKSMNKKDS